MDEQKLEILKRCARDLLYFGRVISPQTFYLESPDFHKELAEILMDRDLRQICVEAPRGSAKSSITLMFVLHHAIFDEGDKLIVMQSKTRPEAINRLTKIKNIIEYDHRFRELFGYCGEQVADIWREDKIKTRIGNYKVTIKALGTGQQIRGALEEDTRITLLLLDDPDDEMSCVTKERMNSNFDAFFGGVAGLDMRNGRVCVIGTPIREGCIVEKLRDAPGWTTKHYKAMNEDTQEVLWSEMYSFEWLKNKKEELKAIGKLSKFYSEYMCEIVGEEDQLFKEEYWKDKRFTGHLEIQGDYTVLVISSKNGIQLKDKEKILLNTYLGVDPASSTKQSADYFVVFPVGMDSKKEIYCLPYFRGRVTPMEGAEKIINKIKEVKPKRGGIETTGYQEMLRQFVKERMLEEGVYCSGFEQTEGYKPKTEKSLRLEQLQPLFAQKKVWIMEEGMQAFIDELLMYPRGKNDDLLDGFYYATRRMFPPDDIPVKQEFRFYPRENELSNQDTWMLN